MLGVLRELAGRYAKHPAFAGLAVRLSADGYAQLPGPDWGLDDATVARFERETNLRLPGSGPRRFAERAAYLAEPSRRRAWLEWRAAQLAQFYRRAAEELAALRPNSRLYLAGADMIGGPELEAELRPALPRRTTLAATLLQLGIDTRHFPDNQPGLVLLRPERIAAEGDLARRAPISRSPKWRTSTAAFRPLRPRQPKRKRGDERPVDLACAAGQRAARRRQPLFPPATAGPHRVVRPEESLQAGLRVAGLPARRVRPAEPAALRP